MKSESSSPRNIAFSQDNWATRHVALFESLGGPLIDCQQSMLALGNRMQLLAFRNGSCTVSGRPELAEAVRTAIFPLRNTHREASLESLLGLARSAVRQFDPESGSSTPILAVCGFEGFRSRNWELVDEEPESELAGMLRVPEAFARWNITGAGALTENPVIWPTDSAAAQRFEGIAGADWEPEPTGSSARIIDSLSRESYLKQAVKALEHIYAGDVYQLQLGHEIKFEISSDPRSLYMALSTANPSPYACLVQAGATTIVSASPELLVRREGSVASMRPLAGTAAAEPDPTAAAKQLIADPKERAEHVMMVDLCRNDLGRVAEPGSLAVSELFGVGRFESVLHMVSTVTAVVSPKVSNSQLLQACTPAGTMTGAPVLRAAELISELEHSERGLYAGYLSVEESARRLTSSLLIRSIFVNGLQASIRASAGIVSDSSPALEWRETSLKLKKAMDTIAPSLDQTLGETTDGQ